MERPEPSPSPDERRVADYRFRTLRALVLARDGAAPTSPESIAEIATAAGASLETTQSLAVWVDRAIQAVRAGRALRLCVNHSCRHAGADALRSEMLDCFAARGHTLNIEDVYCLENCAFGPCAAVDRFVFRGGPGDCREDQRAWR